MKAELVFNDLSIREAPSKQEAGVWFTDMMEAVADLIDEDVCLPSLHANLDLFDIDLMPDEYGFQEWVDDTQTDFELRQLAWTLNTQRPVQKGLADTGEDQFFRSEFKLDDKTDCNALGAALLYDGIAVSLPSDETWQHANVLIFQRLYDEALDNPREISHQVRHASSPQHVDDVIRNWRHGLSQKITNAQQLLAQWDDAFPYLDKCTEYEQKTLPKLVGETLRTALDRLWQLDDACHHWDTKKNPEPPYPMNARPEHPETMKRFGECRIATCPHQGQQQFEMHCDVQPKGYRIYWLENPNMKRLTIGHIGPHLPTKKYPKGM